MPNNYNDFSCFFCEKVKETIKKYSLAEKNEKITVALSGGADSVALLLSLLKIKDEEDLSFSVSACHLNHGIRDCSAIRDENFAKELCEKLSVPFYTERIDIPKLCKTQKGSVETVARNERYEFFRRASAYFGKSLIATAHTMSDNAETLLFNIARGTGTDGICGIPPKRDIFIRPLIQLKRADVEEFLSVQSQDYMTDETNSDDEYSRNFIRHNIVPKLKELNPAFEEAVFRLSESARRDKEYFDIEMKNMPKDRCDINELSELHPSCLSRYIRHICEESDPVMRLSSERVDAISQAVISTSHDGNIRHISLPRKKKAVISKSGICIKENCDDTEKKNSFKFNIPLSFGENIINDTYAVFVTSEYEETVPVLYKVIKNEDIVYKLYITCEVQSAIMNNSLFARPRIEGDFIRLGGISRKLKKVYSEKHIDVFERNLLPVICDEKGNIISTPLFSSACDTAKPQKSDKKITLAFYKA